MGLTHSAFDERRGLNRRRHSQTPGGNDSQQQEGAPPSSPELKVSKRSSDAANGNRKQRLLHPRLTGSTTTVGHPDGQGSTPKLALTAQVTRSAHPHRRIFTVQNTRLVQSEQPQNSPSLEAWSTQTSGERTSPLSSQHQKGPQLAPDMTKGENSRKVLKPQTSINIVMDTLLESTTHSTFLGRSEGSMGTTQGKGEGEGEGEGPGSASAHRSSRPQGEVPEVEDSSKPKPVRREDNFLHPNRAYGQLARPRKCRQIIVVTSRSAKNSPSPPSELEPSEPLSALRRPSNPRDPLFDRYSPLLGQSKGLSDSPPSCTPPFAMQRPLAVSELLSVSDPTQATSAHCSQDKLSSALSSEQTIAGTSGPVFRKPASERANKSIHSRILKIDCSSHHSMTPSGTPVSAAGSHREKGRSVFLQKPPLGAPHIVGKRSTIPSSTVNNREVIASLLKRASTPRMGETMPKRPTLNLLASDQEVDPQRTVKCNSPLEDPSHDLRLEHNRKSNETEQLMPLTERIHSWTNPPK